MQDLFNKHRNILLYGIIGATGALIDLIAYVILYKLGLSPVLASFISVSLGIINNFLLNSRFNFKVTDNLKIRFMQFYIVGVFGALLSSALIFIFIYKLGIDPLTAKILTIVPVVFLQFIVNKKVTFSDASPTFIVSIIRNKILIIFVLTAIVLFLIGMITSSIGTFPDEDDNILGGLLINYGYHPYLDFFSHHAPLTYYVSSLITWFSGSDLGIFRIIFFAISFALQLLIATIIFRSISKASAFMYLSLVVLFAPAMWTNFLLAETVLSLAILLMIVITTHANWSDHALRNISIVVILFFICALLNPIYGLIPGIILLYAFWHKRQYFKLYLKRETIVFASIIVSILLAISFAVTRTVYFQAFIDDYIVFNSVYYAAFNGEGASIINIVLAPIRFIATLLTLPWTLDILFSMNGAIAVGWLLPVIYYFKHKRYLLSLIIFLIASYTQVRGWNYLVSFDSGGQHAILWRYLGLSFIGIYAPLLFSEARRLKSSIRYVYFALCIFAIVISLFFAGKSLTENIHTILDKKPDTLITNRTFLKDFNDNIELLEDDVIIWAGPFRFEAYFDRPESSASNYFFFLPWQAKCPSCMADLLGDLKTEKPEVIVWDASLVVWGYRADEYAMPIDEYITKNYIQSDKPSLKSYHFINKEVMRKVEQ